MDSCHTSEKLCHTLPLADTAASQFCADGTRDQTDISESFAQFETCLTRVSN
jgi:hypothetical protein